MTTRSAMASRPTCISVREASHINETVQILKRLGGAKSLADDLERWVERRARHDTLTAGDTPKEATVWLLLTVDPNRMLDEKPEVGFELPDERIVTLHPDFDAVLDHIRHTYDPDGQYSDYEGTGSMQNYLHLEGYEFDYKEVKLSELGF